MEQITEKINDLFVSWGFDSSEVGPIMTLVLIIGIAFLADLICRNILLRVVAKLVKKTKATWDDIVFDRKVLITSQFIMKLFVMFRQFFDFLFPFASQGCTNGSQYFHHDIVHDVMPLNKQICCIRKHSKSF